jgi:hypothetical protein
VKRSPAEVHDLYESRWTRVLAAARRHIDGGERSLSRVLRLTEAEWRKMDLRPSRGTAFGEQVTMPRSALFGARRAVQTTALAGACRPETSLIVELGSGWGNNLLDLYLSGGPRHVPYYGLELTAAGRECARLLADLEPGLQLITLPFDYRAPDYTRLPRDNPHVVVFTSHSVEVIPQLGEDVITKLFDLGSSLTGVHFEPIGWQVRPNRTAIGATREYSLAQGYNENFWQVLSRLAERREIAIETTSPDMFHHKTSNASTLVVWRRNAAAEVE